VTGLIRQDQLIAVRPGAEVAIRRRGKDRRPQKILYGIAGGWFGECLIASTDKGMCWLDLRPGPAALEELQQIWAPCDISRNDSVARSLAAQVFDAAPRATSLHLCGTDFQLRVWQALLGIEPGHYMSYGQLAQCIGAPRAARAVGRAVGANRIGLVVPCHRVLPASGQPGAYRWGPDFKVALLRGELAQ